ncbi:MAG: MGH1-like glycoside hydrolase domain-containing protein [Treponema sp.]
MNKRDFPRVHFYDQDFVDIYDRTWSFIQDFFFSIKSEKGSTENFFLYPEQYPENTGMFLNQYETILSTFFFVYSNRNYNANQNLDFFYAHQEETGAIRAKYNLETGEPVLSSDNPEGVGMPLFAWAEYNMFHKTANKKRVKDVMPVLTRYMKWLENNFRQPNGLYAVPLAAVEMYNTPREKAAYLVDFNAALATNALYMSVLGDILNDKELSFQYKRIYFTLKTRINSLMWNDKTGFYHDIDEKKAHIPTKTIAGFWPLLAEIPNEDKAALLTAHLSNPETFGSDHPIPSLSLDDPAFDARGMGARGSVFPFLNFIVIKGLERYERWELARECAIRHIYYVLDGLAPDGNSKKGALWEAYQPQKEGAAQWPENPQFPRKQYICSTALSTITLMIENVIGLSISFPRKTVDWIIPNLEVMGIENLSLKRNLVTILSSKTQRGWEIHMESEKLYYFTINILGQKKKTLPIPSGKCSMLIDKL